jgi:hypothetical protein
MLASPRHTNGSASIPWTSHGSQRPYPRFPRSEECNPIHQTLCGCPRMTALCDRLRFPAAASRETALRGRWRRRSHKQSQSAVTSLDPSSPPSPRSDTCSKVTNRPGSRTADLAMRSTHQSAPARGRAANAPTSSPSSAPTPTVINGQLAESPHRQPPNDVHPQVMTTSLPAPPSHECEQWIWLIKPEFDVEDDRRPESWPKSHFTWSAEQR